MPGPTSMKPSEDANLMDSDEGRKRPLLLRMLPESLRQMVYWRLFHRSHHEWPDLFRFAPLSMVPGTAMHDLLEGDIISGNIAFTGFYERELSRAIIRLSVGGGLLVDVGANMGYFSLLWAAGSLHGCSIAFEPVPRNAERILLNAQRNGLTQRIRVVSKAVGRESGRARFDLGPQDQSGWGGFTTQSEGNICAVDVVRLDEELAGQEIEVLKVDVEGADTWVIQGCERLLRQRKIRRIFFEHNQVRMKALGIEESEAAGFLKSVGYTCRPLGSAGTEFVAEPA